jgi:hypothetical protein
LASIFKLLTKEGIGNLLKTIDRRKNTSSIFILNKGMYYKQIRFAHKCYVVVEDAIRFVK